MGVYSLLPQNGPLKTPPILWLKFNDKIKFMWLEWCIHGFINCISEISNTQIEDAHDIDVVMSMYKLIEYTDIYSKITGSLWQYYRDEPALGNNGNKIFLLVTIIVFCLNLTNKQQGKQETMAQMKFKQWFQ